MKKKKKIFEGRTKKLYATEETDQFILEFKSEQAVFDDEKKEVIKGKGAINNQISAFLFEYLEGFNISTHLIKQLGNKDMLVKELKMIPVEVLVRNIAAGSLVKRYGLDEGAELRCPILEFYYKRDEKQNQMINQSHIIAFDLATADEIKMIERLSTKINAVLKSFFLRRQVQLVDFKLEFGRSDNKLVLGDEISADTCRFWEVLTGGQLDKSRFRFDKGNIENAYEEIKNRVLK